MHFGALYWCFCWFLVAWLLDPFPYTTNGCAVPMHLGIVICHMLKPKTEHLRITYQIGISGLWVWRDVVVEAMNLTGVALAMRVLLLKGKELSLGFCYFCTHTTCFSYVMSTLCVEWGCHHVSLAFWCTDFSEVHVNLLELAPLVLVFGTVLGSWSCHTVVLYRRMLLRFTFHKFWHLSLDCELP
jgi:hypothetical protein